MTKEERNTLIVAMYSQGKSFSEICSTCKISDAQAKRVVKKAGLTKNRKPATINVEDEKKIVQLYLDGCETKDISARFNVSGNRIRQFVKSHGYKLRPLGNQYRIWSKEEIEKIIHLSKENISQEKIAKELGTNDGTIHKLLLQHYPEGIQTKRLRENHPNWKGGTVLASKGQYRQIKLYPDDDFYDMTTHAGYVMEHRLVMAKSLGRSLTPDETVHHIDGNTLNNDLLNLQLRQGLHGKGQKFVCCKCGSHDIKSVEI